MVVDAPFGPSQFRREFRHAGAFDGRKRLDHLERRTGGTDGVLDHVRDATGTIIKLFTIEKRFFVNVRVGLVPGTRSMRPRKPELAGTDGRPVKLAWLRSPMPNGTNYTFSYE